jgi:hypothetical protein
MSTSLLAKVQFTSTPTVPDAVVVNTTSVRNLVSSDRLPCETTLVTSGDGVGIGEG